MDVSQETQKEEAPTKAEEVVKEETTEGTSPAVAESLSMIERAEQVRKAMEDANKKHEELTARDEAVAARMMLGDRGRAGEPTKSPEEENKEKLDADIAKTISRFK